MGKFTRLDKTKIYIKHVPEKRAARYTSGRATSQAGKDEIPQDVLTFGWLVSFQNGEIDYSYFFPNKETAEKFASQVKFQCHILGAKPWYYHNPEDMPWPEFSYGYSTNTISTPPVDTKRYILEFYVVCNLEFAEKEHLPVQRVDSLYVLLERKQGSDVWRAELKTLPYMLAMHRNDLSRQIEGLRGDCAFNLQRALVKLLIGFQSGASNSQELYAELVLKSPE